MWCVSAEPRGGDHLLGGNQEGLGAHQGPVPEQVRDERWREPVPKETGK